MSKRRPIWIVLGLAALALGVWGWRASRPARPNILFVTLDTTRADRIGCYGYASADTPRLDALAARGIVFDRAYAAAPMTAPSHASMFTGRWPPEHGVFTNGQVALGDDIPTVAERLSAAGYDTAAFVAAFVLQAKFGLQRGFAVYDDDLSRAEPGGDELHRYRDGKYVIDAALRWLTNGIDVKSSTPFFCWVHLYDPHDPYLSHPDDFGSTFAERPYDGEIAYVDRQLGRLLDKLDDSGLAENTVIIIAGDHGEGLGEHGERTHGYTLYGATLRVPLIVADPRSTARGTRVTTPVSLVDLFATLMEIGGDRVAKDLGERSLAPALRGQPLPPRTIYAQTEEPYLQAYWSPLQAWTTERWRYIRTTKPELYDLANDPGETNNLAESEPERLGELETELTLFETKLRHRTAGNVQLSERERRALESLGYVGEAAKNRGRAVPGGDLPDIKDMLESLNQLDDASELMEQKEYAEAAELLEPLAENVPNLLRARLNLGLCRLRQERYEDAAHWFEAALEIDEHSDRARDMLGFCYLKLKQLDAAEEQFQRLLERNPESEHALLFLGEIAQRREDYPLAMRRYAGVLRINPQNRQARDAFEALRQAGVRF